MSELHPLVDVDHRSAPLARFYAEPVTITTADRQVAGIVVDVWRWFTGDATGVRVDNGDHLVPPDDQEWTITHRDRSETYRHNSAGNPLTRTAGIR
jgi:hypothetical protein